MVNQVDECDYLMDRPSIVHYVNSNAWDLTFNYRCDVLEQMASSSNKPCSRLFIQYSAEEPGYFKCFGTESIGEDFLGDYLDGTGSNNGNMFSVEKEFKDLLDNLSYLCPHTNTNIYSENHYSTSNPYGNQILGSLWFTYSMLLPQYNTPLQSSGITLYRLKSNNLKSSSEKNENQISLFPNPISDHFMVSNGEVSIKKCELLNLDNKLISSINCNNGTCVLSKNVSPGVYFVRFTFENNQAKYHRIIID